MAFAPTLAYADKRAISRAVEEWLEETKTPSVLVAGEAMDGLNTDGYTGFSELLIPLFDQQERHSLLFRTKATPYHLLKREPSPQVIICWSAGGLDEFEGAPPVERLECAAGLRGCGMAHQVAPRPDVHGNEVRLVHRSAGTGCGRQV